METIYKFLEKYAPLFLRIAIAMAFTAGIKSPLDYSVFTASAGALLLSIQKK